MTTTQTQRSGLARDGDAAGIQAIMPCLSGIRPAAGATGRWTSEETAAGSRKPWTRRSTRSGWRPFRIGSSEQLFVRFSRAEGYWPSAENSIYVVAGIRGTGIGKTADAAHSGAGGQQQAADDRRGDRQRQRSEYPVFTSSLDLLISGRLPRVGWKQDRWLDLVLMTCDVNGLRQKNPGRAKNG